VKAADIVALPLKMGSAVRHRRVFHPVGVLASGHVERVPPPGVGLPVDSADILGRVSTAIGVPGGLPDLIGLAWRMPPHDHGGTPWDVLTVSAGFGLAYALRAAAHAVVVWHNAFHTHAVADGRWLMVGESPADHHDRWRSIARGAPADSAVPSDLARTLPEPLPGTVTEASQVLAR
jgi:hypothetical protein